MSAPLPCVEVEPPDPPRAAVIWLHGLGADGHDFEPIPPQLALPGELPVRFVFPHAPHRPVTLNGGYVMRAWYDLFGLDAGAPQDEGGIREAAQALGALIERERQRGLPYERILLAGFSQGGAVALHAGLRFAARLAGVIALSTYLPLRSAVAAERHATNAALPIFMAHGTQDGVIPVQYARLARDTLAPMGYPIAWHEYAMAHGLCHEEIADLRAWMVQVLRGQDT